MTHERESISKEKLRAFLSYNYNFSQ